MSDTPYQIEIHVETQYIPDQSDEDEKRYVFAYTITIRNTGEKSAQLLSRRWRITDGDGKEQQVEGEGVVGEQPKLEPGEEFRYTSGTVIETPVGSMEGAYQMVGEDGDSFEAPIPPFTLAQPNTLH